MRECQGFEPYYLKIFAQELCYVCAAAAFVVIQPAFIYVYMSICIHVCMYICVYAIVYMRMRVWLCICVCAHIFVCARMHTSCLRVCTHSCVRVVCVCAGERMFLHLGACVCKCTFPCAHICIYVYVHTEYKYVYIYTYTRVYKLHKHLCPSGALLHTAVDFSIL